LHGQFHIGRVHRRGIVCDQLPDLGSLRCRLSLRPAWQEDQQAHHKSQVHGMKIAHAFSRGRQEMLRAAEPFGALERLRSR